MKIYVMIRIIQHQMKMRHLRHLIFEAAEGLTLLSKYSKYGDEIIMNSSNTDEVHEVAEEDCGFDVNHDNTTEIRSTADNDDHRASASSPGKTVLFTSSLGNTVRLRQR